MKKQNGHPAPIGEWRDFPLEKLPYYRLSYYKLPYSQNDTVPVTKLGNFPDLYHDSDFTENVFSPNLKFIFH